MENIFIIKDNHLYDEMRDLRPAVINRIHDNVCKLQRAGVNIRVCSSSDSLSENESFIRRNGYQEVPSLYERLIMEYNNANPENILHGWPRSNEER